MSSEIRKDRPMSGTEERRRRSTGNDVTPVMDVVTNDPWKSENHRSSMPASLSSDHVRFISMNGTIADPPKFPAEAYEEYRRNVRFWNEIHGYFEEGQLVAKLAMRADGPLKIIIIRYLKEEKDAKRRKVGDIIKLLDAEFARPTQEVIITKINCFMSLSRRVGEDIRLFWIRFEKARIAAELTDTVLPEAVLYSRALNALKLSATNKVVLLSGLEASGSIPTLKTLKEVSVKIFGNTSDEAKVVLEATDDGSRIE